MTMLRKSSLGLAVAACLLVSGCRAAKPQYKYRIAVVPKGTSHDFWKSIHAGAVQAARQRGDTQVLWEGPATEDQVHVQQQIVEQFTSQGVSALILAPCDRRALVRPVRGMIEKGIPVVIIDSGLELSDFIQNSDQYLGYVATDNRQGGVEAAKRMIDLLKDKERPHVAMIRYQAGSESTEQREAGFRDTIKSMPQIDFIEAADEAGATVESALRVAERFLSSHKELDGIFVPNESSTHGFLRALELLNRAGQVKLVGFDANPTLLAALKEGKLHGLVLQDPFDMGYQSVLRAVDHLEGKQPPKGVQNTNLKVVTKENMDDPEIKLLYARDLKPILGE